jgi:hypothetical protein
MVRARFINPPRNHTRASRMASTFNNQNHYNALLAAIEPSKSLFKMQKFLAVKPRLDTVNHGYKPPTKSYTCKSQIRT